MGHFIRNRAQSYHFMPQGARDIAEFYLRNAILCRKENRHSKSSRNTFRALGVSNFLNQLHISNTCRKLRIRVKNYFSLKSCWRWRSILEERFHRIQQLSQRCIFAIVFVYEFYFLGSPLPSFTFKTYVEIRFKVNKKIINKFKFFSYI